MQAINEKGMFRLSEVQLHQCFSFLDSEKHEGNVYTNPPVPSQNPPQPTKKCLFGKSLTSIFEDKKLPGPILVSIILGFCSTFVLRELFNQTDEGLDDLSMRLRSILNRNMFH